MLKKIFQQLKVQIFDINSSERPCHLDQFLFLILLRYCWNFLWFFSNFALYFRPLPHISTVHLFIASEGGLVYKKCHNMIGYNSYNNQGYNKLFTQVRNLRFLIFLSMDVRVSIFTFRKGKFLLCGRKIGFFALCVYMRGWFINSRNSAIFSCYNHVQIQKCRHARYASSWRHENPVFSVSKQGFSTPKDTVDCIGRLVDLLIDFSR